MLAVVYLLTWRWREAVLYRTPTAWLAAVFLFATAIPIYPRSRLHFFHIQAIGRKKLEPGREPRLITRQNDFVSNLGSRANKPTSIADSPYSERAFSLTRSFSACLFVLKGFER